VRHCRLRARVAQTLQKPCLTLARRARVARSIDDAEAGGARGSGGASSSGASSFEIGKIGDVARRIGTSVKDTAAGAASIGSRRADSLSLCARPACR
jgi:hypothetical protein